MFEGHHDGDVISLTRLPVNNQTPPKSERVVRDGMMSHLREGYYWRTQTCRKLCIPHALLEGKKAWKTYASKSTSRTLQQIRQQYPPLFCDSALCSDCMTLTTRCHRDITPSSS